MGEWEAARDGALPELVREADIRGVVHAHSTYSDGADTVEAMARACREAGYGYLVLCDHSRSAFYAGGLPEEAVLRQHDEIDRLNGGLAPFRILKGIETEILRDGSLDYPDEFLARFEFVIASIHSSFQMPREEMTARILRALAHPMVDLVGHPTGRLVLGRPGYQVDVDALIDGAARWGKALELNAHPYRLDLDWRRCRRARERGVPVSINPDAHETAGIRDIRYGVMVARKGWLRREDVLNARGARSCWPGGRRGCAHDPPRNAESIRAGGHPGPGVGLPRGDRRPGRRRSRPLPGEPGARCPELARRGPAVRCGTSGGGHRAAAGGGRPAGLQAADRRPGRPGAVYQGDRVWLGGPVPAGTEARRIPLDFAEIDCRPRAGDELLLRDGRIRLAVVRAAGDGCLCSVTSGGEAVGRMGVALAGEAGVRVRRSLPQDLLKRCLRGGVRAFLLSYCEEAADVSEVEEACRALGVEGVRLIPKIETLRALDNLPAILEACDTLCIARGDLGTQVALPDLPGVERRLLAEARAAGRRAWVAGEVLGGFARAASASRGELAGVWSALDHGAAGFILSDETAVGPDPAGAVRLLKELAKAWSRRSATGTSNIGH